MTSECVVTKSDKNGFIKQIDNKDRVPGEEFKVWHSWHHRSCYQNKKPVKIIYDKNQLDYGSFFLNL